VYVWNGSAYEALNLSSTGYIHPGQGFFVHSGVASGNAAITEAMQELFPPRNRSSNNNPTINLILSDGTNSKETQINYLEGKTLGLDPGFDVGMFDGTSSNLRVFTHLIEDNQGIAFEKQSLPNSDFESMVIPVGIKAAAGEEIIFSVEALNLPTI